MANQHCCNNIASTATAATSKEYFAATYKIKQTIWGDAFKATLSRKAALFVVLRRSIEQVSKMLAPRGSGGHQLLLLSLNYRLIRLQKQKKQ